MSPEPGTTGADTHRAARGTMSQRRGWRLLAAPLSLGLLSVMLVVSPAAGSDDGAPLPALADPDTGAARDGSSLDGASHDADSTSPDGSAGAEADGEIGEASGDRFSRLIPDAWEPAHDSTADGGTSSGGASGTSDAGPSGDGEDTSFTLAATGDDAIAIRRRVRDAAGFLPRVQIHGGGWGHGVGMSQYGAYAMAQNGHGPTAILTHYYPGTQVRDDARPVERRIRAGIRTNQTVSPIRAVDQPIVWYACTPETGRETERVPMDRCVEWFEQTPDIEARVVPFEDGVQIERRVEDPAEGDDEWQVFKTTGRRVARAVHGDNEILAQSTSEVLRTYRFGWRDYHNLPGSSQRLAVVQDVDSVERYLRGLAESPNSWGVNGESALRAQAITGRTYALRRLISPRGGLCACDLLSTPADQVFNGEDKVNDLYGSHWATAVERTAGLVLLYDGVLAETYYSSSHGMGRSENVEESWAYGTTAVPYLRSVDDPWSSHPDAGNPRASWTVPVDNNDVAQFVSAGLETPLARVERLEVATRTQGGTPATLEVTGVTVDGVRTSLTYDGRPQGSKPIAGASMRRYLAVTDGGTGGRLNSSQIAELSFAPFTDDDVHVHEFAISWAAHAGVVRGVDEDTFAPNRAVTREQMATYLVNTFDIPMTTNSGTFVDVNPGDTHAANIEAVVAAGVARGVDEDHFAPGRAVTRAQMATFLAQALDLTTERTGTFSDVDGGTHEESIEAIAEHGITTGCDAERFCPGEPVQRGQLASFLHRVVGD